MTSIYDLWQALARLPSAEFGHVYIEDAEGDQHHVFIATTTPGGGGILLRGAEIDLVAKSEESLLSADEVMRAIEDEVLEPPELTEIAEALFEMIEGGKEKFSFGLMSDLKSIYDRLTRFEQGHSELIKTAIEGAFE
jgi:hypothetical protein